MEMQQVSLPPLIVEFKQLYNTFDKDSLVSLGQLYSEDVTFADPLHVIQGLPALTQYFYAMCGNLTECRFEFIDEIVGQDSAFFKWHMHYRHPSIRANKLLTLTGATLIHFSDKIDRHEDFYDMGAMLYEHIPLIGSAIGFVKSRIIRKK